MDGCGDVIGEPCGFEVECDLEAGHEGDHHAVVTWPRTVWSQSTEPSPMAELTQRIWGPSISDLLTQVQRLNDPEAQ